MILPTKRLSQDRSLLYVGAEILRLVGEPKTISRLWQELQSSRSAQSGLAPFTYDWFILALDLLFLTNAVRAEGGRIELDPELGDRVAQAFRGEYEALRNANLTLDDIFARLQLIENSTTLATPSRQAAALTALPYLLEERDIFERPPEEAAS